MRRGTFVPLGPVAGVALESQMNAKAQRPAGLHAAFARAMAKYALQQHSQMIAKDHRIVRLAVRAAIQPLGRGAKNSIKIALIGVLAA
ncbi:hypothetical protein [Primorskyibacter sp. 2E233]|uniref:hypothetical protein n=1 Tax=Primorskyibacter sp. 2E233 TaxID=3413431 RepID=UPI003BF22CCB